MRRERHQVDPVFIYVNRYFANRLCSVGKQQHAVLAGNGADFFNWLNNADLVIRVHDSDQYCCRLNSCFQFLQIDQPLRVHRQVRYFAAQLFDVFAGIQNSFVLGYRCDDVIALAGVHFKYTFDGQVIAFGCSAGKDDLLWIGANQFGHLFTGIIDSFFRRPAKRVVPAGRISEMIQEIRCHGFQYPGIHGCGSVIV